ncbi:MAG: beta-galactosidase [Armatimonadetes bacterium]|nr:beta-galactosidase [Armatimonadota bacterium]
MINCKWIDSPFAGTDVDRWHWSRDMLRVSNDQYITNNSPTPLLCGELHYFRMDPEVWNERLVQLKDAGCNAVASYVPWEVHELEEGKFDFVGSTNPRRNLKLWLDLVAASGLTLFIRPGPLVYAEMVRTGWPGWLQKNYPEVESMVLRDGKLVRGSEARNPEEAAVSYLHPVYLEKAGNWLRAVTDFVKPYFENRSGPISLWQLCNEIPGAQTWLAGMDRSPEAIGMGRREGHYPSFLRQRYGAPESLCEAYGIKCADFAAVSWEDLATAKKDVVEADYASFYHEVYIPAYVQWLEKTVRDAGVDVTLTTNSGNPNEVTVQKEAAVQSPGVVFGVDCYYHLYETGLGAIGLAYLCELGASIVEECSPGPATIWEAECGYWFDYPQLEPDDIYLFLMWSYISGFKGISMYLFAGGDNWPGLGMRGTYHDWQGPVGADGGLMPHYYSIQRAMREIVNDNWVLQSKRVCDLSIGVYAQESLRGLSHFLFEGSVSYDVVDVKHTPLAQILHQFWKSRVWEVSGSSFSSCGGCFDCSLQPTC